jgi:HK97 family phage portal protein
LTYTYSFQGHVTDPPLTEEQVFHIKGFSLDGLVGMSPITMARQSIGSAMAAEKASGSFFRNGMQPSAMMKAPTYLTAPQREQANVIIEKFSGAMNTGKVPLIEGGWDLTQLSLKPEDAQLLQTRSFHVAQLCRWFDVPPVMIGHLEKSTAWGTGLEQMMQWFLTFSLRPHLKRIEQAISKALLTTDEQLTHYAEFNVEGLLRADSAGRAQLYKVLVENGLRTRNELRALDNEPPHPDGDDLTVMSNMLPIQLLGQVARIPSDKPVDPNFVPSGPSSPSGSEGGTGGAGSGA